MGIFYIFTEEKRPRNDFFPLILIDESFSLTYFGSN